MLFVWKKEEINLSAIKNNNKEKNRRAERQRVSYTLQIQQLNKAFTRYTHKYLKWPGVNSNCL